MIAKDLKLQQMYARRGLKKSRITTYNRVFQRIYDISELTPSKLVQIARDEQRPKIVNNQLEFKEIEDRTITQVQYDLYYLLQELGLKPSTVRSELSAYRAFLNEYDIQLPKAINIRVNQPLFEEGDLPKKEHILQAIRSTNNKRNKAIIYFMSSSGIRPVDVRNFTIRDFLKGCQYYLDDDLTLENLYKSDYENFIPNFYFRPQKTSNFDNVCCTFCTPETTVAIVNYLKTRHISSLDEPLFLSRYGNKMNRSTFISMFQRINDKEFGSNSKGERFFQAKYLRKYFINTCNRNSGDLLKVRLLAGHTLADIDRAYNEISIPVMRVFYTKLIPYLSLHDTSVKTVKTKEYMDLEKKLERQQLENEKLKDELDDRINSAIENVLNRYK